MSEKDNKPKLSFNEKWRALKEKKYFKVLINKYFIASFVFLIIIFFIDKNNLVNWGRNYYQVLQQEKLIRQYEEDIRNTDEKLKELTSDKDSLEKFAREQYFFQEKGEEVFIVK